MALYLCRPRLSVMHNDDGIVSDAAACAESHIHAMYVGEGGRIVAPIEPLPYLFHRYLHLRIPVVCGSI